MYFLTRLVLLDPAVPWEAVQDVLGGSPRGFRRTADQRISRIVNDFGTVAGFIQDRITDHFMGGVGSPDDSHDPLDVPEPRSDDPDKRIWQSIKERRGQPQFRQALLRLYQDKCAVTGHGPKDVLEAAHIQPHAIAGRNSTDNGLLLRADIHTLFDLRLLWIEPESLAVRIAPSLRGSPYSELDGKVLRPRVDGSRPNNTYLQERSRSG